MKKVKKAKKTVCYDDFADFCLELKSNEFKDCAEITSMIFSRNLVLRFMRDLKGQESRSSTDLKFITQEQIADDVDIDEGEILEEQINKMTIELNQLQLEAQEENEKEEENGDKKKNQETPEKPQIQSQITSFFNRK